LSTSPHSHSESVLGRDRVPAIFYALYSCSTPDSSSTIFYTFYDYLKKELS
jgi:hypothetical protein